MIDNKSSDTQNTKTFSMWVASPGMIALAICVLLSVGVGFYTAYSLRGESTLIAAMSIFIFPAPYLLFALVGLAMVQNRQSRTLAMSFNVGGGVLLVTWWVVNCYIDAPGDTLAQHLNTTLVYTVIASGVLVVLLVGLLYVVNKLIWTEQ